MKDQQTQVTIGGVTDRQRIMAVFLALVVLGLSVMYADIDISFSSRLDAVNQQSDGSPLDTSFTFELGSFGSDPSFVPGAGNTAQWLSKWVAAPNSNPDPLSGSSVAYTQAPLPGFVAPITMASNQFSGSITLTSNTSPFGTSDQAYIWGFDDRGASGTGEWILITNPGWLYPPVGVGPQFGGGVDWSVTDSGTVALLGSVNPEFAKAADDPHLVTGSVILAPTVPEPSVAVLFLGALSLLLVPRRR